jgi:ligand-binding sensor domain-containing protein
MAGRIFYLIFSMCFITAVLLSAPAAGQIAAHEKNLRFYQLNTTHGLSDNHIAALCSDKNGNLWVGTAEGLNRFNGKSNTKFFKQDHPQLANNNIQALVPDNNNRIWIGCEGGFATMIDEDRRFHKITLADNDKRIVVKKIFNTPSKGIVLFTSQGFYQLTQNKNLQQADSVTVDFFSPLLIKGFDTLAEKNF